MVVHGNTPSLPDVNGKDPYEVIIIYISLSLSMMNTNSVTLII